ncbi:hypothetical protein FOZ60_016918 [Perkinsus olseni]|uniref:Uncharacterized protein n=1 Tax=Perkinsus olseni TaxID=32597 RepID=A0A7J6P3L5_PEROL|nr:hypothetical protein FOZ60_016918 [Perkinsus olseni]
MIYACALLFATACASLDAGPLGGYVPNGQVEGDYPIRIFDFESQMYVKLADRDFQPHLGTSFRKGTTLEIKLSDDSLGALEKKYPKKINSTTFTTVKFDGKKNIITITYADVWKCFEIYIYLLPILRVTWVRGQYEEDGPLETGSVEATDDTSTSPV